MLPFVGAAALAFGAIFVAEFGDKSQLLVLAFATRYPARLVVPGVVLAAAIIQGVSVLIGAAAGALLSETAVGILAGAAFLGVAAWIVLAGADDDPTEPAASSGRLAGLAVVSTVAITFIIGELGDKTMLATFALAASQGPLATWIGSTLGEISANLVAVAVGRQVGTRLSARLVRLASAVLFGITGIAVLVGALVDLIA